MKNFLSIAQLSKVLPFTFHYMDGDSITLECSIIQALEHYYRSSLADLFVGKAKNCTIYIDGEFKKMAEAYLGFSYGEGDNRKFFEFIIASIGDGTFEDGTKAEDHFGIDCHNNESLRLSPEFIIER